MSDYTPENDAERNFRWAYRLLLVLAKRILLESHTEDRTWPLKMKWSELVSSSHAVFLRMAREEAGIPNREFLELIRNGTYCVDDLYDQAEKEPCFRCKGDDADQQISEEGKVWLCQKCSSDFTTFLDENDGAGGFKMSRFLRTKP